MKIAMLGTGFIGRFYADSLQGYRSKDKIVTIYSRKEESTKKFAEDYKVAFQTTSMEEAMQTAIREVGLALGARRVSANIHSSRTSEQSKESVE